MPSLRTFRIEFEKPNATYMAGEMVTGSIILDIAKVKNVRGFYFTAKGAAHVRWTERTRRRGENQHRTYSASQKYFSIRADILEPSDLDSRIHITEGYHRYPFEFQVPSNIPSSFEHEHGHIRYTVKAVIDRPWKFDHECKAAFTVVSMLDLNAHRNKCVGIYDEYGKTFCFCFFNKGKMNIVTQTPSSGYVPGQTINTMVNYTNTSEIQITKITTKLQRVLKLHATSKTKTEHSEISSTSYAGPFASEGVANLEIRVPPIPPSFLSFCKIIDLTYNLKVVVHVTGLHCKIERSYPLLIGSIPLYCAPSAPPIEELKNTSYPTMPMPMPEIPGTSNSPPPCPGFVVPDQAGAPINWNIPPPSYEECMSGAQNIRDDDESDHVQGASMPFSPKYPVFNYPSIGMQEKR